MADDWLTRQLKTWARWAVGRVDGAGAYEDRSVLWDAVYRPDGGVPHGSRPLAGGEIPQGAARVEYAMACLSDDPSLRLDIQIVRSYHAMGEARTQVESGMSNRAMFGRKAKGEAAIRGFLIAVDAVLRRA